MRVYQENPQGNLLVVLGRGMIGRTLFSWLWTLGIFDWCRFGHCYWCQSSLTSGLTCYGKAVWIINDSPANKTDRKYIPRQHRLWFVGIRTYCACEVIGSRRHVGDVEPKGHHCGWMLGWTGPIEIFSVLILPNLKCQIFSNQFKPTRPEDPQPAVSRSISDQQSAPPRGARSCCSASRRSLLTPGATTF